MIELTSEQLVRSILSEETCILYDKERINNLIKNTKVGFGKLATNEGITTITIPVTKNKKFVYMIPLELMDTIKV